MWDSGCHFFRRPFCRRVPSGNIAITWPSRASASAVRIASRSRSPRCTLNAPAPVMICPSGGQKSSDFAMKRRNRRGQRARPRANGSKFETCPAARTKPPSRGRCSCPTAR